jgi:hypothetical protein
VEGQLVVLYDSYRKDKIQKLKYGWLVLYKCNKLFENGSTEQMNFNENRLLIVIITIKLS